MQSTFRSHEKPDGVAPHWLPLVHDDRYLRVCQINLKGAQHRLFQLHEHLKEMKRPFDIVAFQDPPKTILWTKTVGYELWFESERGLTEDDHPRLVGRDEQANDNLPAGRRVGFLVSKTIAKSALDFA